MTSSLSSSAWPASRSAAVLGATASHTSSTESGVRHLAGCCAIDARSGYVLLRSGRTTNSNSVAEVVVTPLEVSKVAVASGCAVCSRSIWRSTCRQVNDKPSKPL